MHLTEALLAAHAATGDGRFLDRAEFVARRVCLDLADQTGGLLWEHYDEGWRADLAYNRDRPDDMFRPWGVLSGHLLEWAKLLVLLDRARPSGWAIPTARRFFASAADRAWDEACGGFLYSFALDGRIVDDRKYHWVIAEAIGASAALWAATGDAAYRDWYDRCWGWALAHQIDRERGGWWPGLARDGSRVELPFAPGKPELYHPLGACLGSLESFGIGAAGDDSG
jgi:mannose/cellobiose epimerase-like protein (N-acyl-D-glucosamine 2-epimerase family)